MNNVLSKWILFYSKSWDYETWLVFVDLLCACHTSQGGRRVGGRVL